ncbi:MAG: HAD family hydrolase [Thermoplasmatota archaeon]
MRTKAVVFDVDGVLVESMPRHAEAYARVFAKRGVTIEPRDVYRREGKNSHEVIRSIVEERGLAFSAPELAAMSEEKQEIFYSYGALPVYPAVAATLAACKRRDWRIGLASGTWRANVEQHLADLLGGFDAVVTADDVKHTKPDPEPYLKAMSLLGVKPAETLVVENAPLGLASGQASGARVAIVLTTLPRDDLPGADAYFSDLDALRDAIEQGEFD